VPLYRRPFTPGHLQFITSSTYRRTPLFSSERLARVFVEVLEGVRAQLGFALVGWVLMPEHFHLLLLPRPAESATLIVKQLKQQTAYRVLASLRENIDRPWCEKILARLRLPSTVHDESQYRVWQRRFYPFNVYSEKKRLEKLDYMHNNPVTRGLAERPGDWRLSSWRFYYLEDASVLRTDRLG
jgi:REP-associated tyrosine transposase